MTDTMAAVVHYGAEPMQVELRAVPTPTPGEDDVVLRVDAAAVCGSDVHQWAGHPSWAVEHPVVLGHEFMGRVADAGSRVTGFEPGERVVSETAARIDADSPYLRTGTYNLDPRRLGFGTRVDGGMAEYVRVPARCLHRVPEGLSDRVAALTEPTCNAYNAVCVQSRVKPGDRVAVIGPGPIGLLCAWVAGRAGDEHRLEHGRRLGATLTYAGDGPATRDALMEDAGDGYDLVVDAAGHSASLEVALAVVRPGGQITKIGWGPQPLGFSLDPLVAKAVTLRGSFSHTWDTWERVLGLLAVAQDELEPLVEWTGPLATWREAFEQMRAGVAIKSVLFPNGGPDAG